MAAHAQVMGRWPASSRCTDESWERAAEPQANSAQLPGSGLSAIRYATAPLYGIIGACILSQLDRSEQEVARLEIPAESVAGLLEEPAAVLGVGFGPQGGDELVAADAARAWGGDEGAQRQRLALLGRAGPRGAVDFDRESAERLEVEPVAPSDRSLTGLLRTGSNLAPGL
jgi:hypothetical protein